MPAFSRLRTDARRTYVEISSNHRSTNADRIRRNRRRGSRGIRPGCGTENVANLRRLLLARESGSLIDPRLLFACVVALVLG